MTATKARLSLLLHYETAREIMARLDLEGVDDAARLSSWLVEQLNRDKAQQGERWRGGFVQATFRARPKQVTLFE